MEPDIIRMYTSSPPPLEDAAKEEKDEEFGDFGGFSGMASSVSFSEFDAPKGFGQSRTMDISPPGHLGSTVAASFPQDFTPGGPGRGDCEPCDPGCSHASPLPDRIFAGEAVRKPIADGGRAETHACDCNGDVPAMEVFTNGFTPLDAEETPVVRPKKRGPAAKPTLDCCGHRPVTTRVDTSLLCGLVSNAPQLTKELPGGKSLARTVGDRCFETGLAEMEKNGEEDGSHGTGPMLPAAALAGLNNGVAWGCSAGAESARSDPEPCTERLSARREQSPAVQNDTEDGGVEDELPVCLGTVSASVSDDFASFCRAVSPDRLEDFAVKGFTVLPVLEVEEPSAKPTDEEGNFDQMGREVLDRVTDSAARPTPDSTNEGLEDGGSRKEAEDGQGDFPGSDSFADFSSAVTEVQLDSAGWNAFGQPEETAPARGNSWAVFRVDQDPVPTDENQETCWDAAIAEPPSGCPRTSRSDSLSVSLVSRLERLFRVSFPAVGEPEAGEDVPSLKALLEPPDRQQELGEERSSASHNRGLRNVWWWLQDIHGSFGLRYQWDGSHSNKALLCSLGIDNRNIGMLESTKEPVNPLSLAEKIASIGQSPSTSLEMSPSPDSTQEALLPIRFDWSSSGLTNPLDGKNPGRCEQTMATLQPSGPCSMPDAFAYPFSAVGKTRGSSRKPRQDGTISEEAARVMTALPDLSFMQARVLMFPGTLTCLSPVCT